MNKKNKQTYEAIYQNPIRSDIKWSDVVSLFRSLGAKSEERAGSRVSFELNGYVSVFHRPHPGDIIVKGAVKSIRKFLDNIEVEL